MSGGITYERAGVSPARATKLLDSFSAFLKTRPRDPNVVSGLGPYASTYSLGPALAGVREPMLVTCCDGVGTKLKLAIDWGRMEGIGSDLVAMNVNDMFCMGAQPLAFLDYFACGHIEHENALTILKSIQVGCETAGCALVGGETAEMPGIYQGSDIDLAGFAVGVVDRANVLGPERVQVGDVLIAIASSGLHSNGYSLVRKLVEKTGCSPDSPAAFDPNRSWADVLLEPTTIYNRKLESLVSYVNALAHITGGGLFENLPRVLPKNMTAEISSKAWPWTPLFRWIGENAGITDEDLLSTFNCGVGMLVICPESNRERVIDICRSAGLPAQPIGTVVHRSNSQDAVAWNK